MGQAIRSTDAREASGEIPAVPAARSVDQAGSAARAIEQLRMHAERRHAFRVMVPARASLWRRGQLAGYYTLSDLSIGGCALVSGPQRSEGEELDAVLHIPHRAPLVLAARVVRADDGHVGLKFLHASPVQEEELQDIVVETFAHERTREHSIALVVEPRHAERHTLVRTLRELGKRAVGVATALDAVQLLVEEGSEVDVVFVEAASAALPGMELVEFLAHNHPSVRRVLIADELRPHWQAEVAGEVHAMVETTADRDALRRLLRRLDRAPHDGSPT